MAVGTFDFTTGPSTLPDIGELSYNGCKFSPLFETNVSGSAIKDKANRTVKYMEYVLTADGYVTLPSTVNSINTPMNSLRELLNAQGGDLTYQGRGFNINVNKADGDVAWGPVPEILEFQPLGAGKSAKVQWKVTVRITEPPFAALKVGQSNLDPILQFNFETGVSYGEDYYSSISMRGTMEIPMTRVPSQGTRTLSKTVDNYRSQIETRLMSGIDLSRFRVTRREFNVSRDKRTIDWDIVAEETPYMDMPPDCPIARGTYSVRPAKVGMGLVSWLCTLRATYTVRADRQRRIAWLSFLALLRLRMKASENQPIPVDGGEDKPPVDIGDFLPLEPVGVTIKFLERILKKQKVPVSTQRAWLIDFTFDEGIYLDSKTTAFSATWRLNCTFPHILNASGIWTKLPEKDVNKNNYWAVSMKDVSGVRSWLSNIVDPKLDVIVDFGGG